MNKENKKGELHPVWFFVILSVITIVLSAILSFFGFQGTQTDVSLGSSSTSILTVESLLSGSGIKFIVSESINNFLKFTPLGTIIIGLAGVGLMIKTGLLKSICKRLNKIIPRKTMFFIFSLLCIIMGFSVDFSFVIMIPVAAILFTEYKRSQVVGMTMAFASVAAGANINIFLTSIDYSLTELAKSSVNLVDSNYSYGYTGNLFFVVISSLLLALVISIITEIIARKKPVRIGTEELEISEKLDKIGFKKSLIAFVIMCVLLAYAIIPGLPLSGFLLDSSQNMYINKLFGANSPFVKGLIFVASQFVALFKYTNIGNVVTVNLFNLVADIKPSFIILLLLSFIVIAISNIFVPSLSTKWTLFVPKMMPLFMKSNITPEFTGAMFRLASSVTNIISPIFSYFVVYLGFIGLYSKNDFTIRKCYKMLMPYFIAILILWLFIVFGWYVLKAPIGPNVFPTI